MRVAIYARVSTADQTCEMQLRELREYVQHRGWQVTREYIDNGQSGSKAHRPALDSLMQDARQRRFDAILAWKLDRFGRSLSHLVHAVQELDSLGIRFIVPNQGIDTDRANPTARLLLHILASVAEFERELIRERTRAGMARAKADGVQLGRRHKVFRRDRVHELRQSGASIRAIAAELGCSTGTVTNILKGRFKPAA